MGYAALDVSRKLLVVELRPRSALFLLSVLQVPIFLAWALLAGQLGFGSDYWPPALASVALNIGANLAFMEAVRISPLSLTIPFLSLTPAFVSLLGVPLLREIPGPLQWLGIALTVAGAFWLNLSGGAEGTEGRQGLGAMLLRERGSALMVLVALLWSLAMPLDKIALGRAHASVHGLVLNAGVALGIGIAMSARGELGELRRARSVQPLLLVATFAGMVGMACLLLSLDYLWVGMAEILKRAIGSVLALLLGRALFAESIGAAKVAAVLLMAFGVLLVLA